MLGSTYVINLEKDCDELETQGLPIHFEVEQFIPNTNTKVIGEQIVKFKFFGKGDSKMKLMLNFSVSANVRHCAPECDFSREQQASPLFEVDESNIQTYEQTLEDFTKMHAYISLQEDIYETKKRSIENNKKWNQTHTYTYIHNHKAWGHYLLR